MSSILALIDPKSFGPGNTYADPLFALSTLILRNHLSQIHDHSLNPLQNKENLSFVADASDKVYPCPKPNKSNFALWVSPFGLYAHYKKEGSFPSLRDRSIGGILGFDYNGWDNGMIGGGVAYAFQDIHYSERMGKAKAHQELATFYGAWYGSFMTIEGALWGGIYQLHNHRKTLGFIPSKSSIHGGLFSPHISLQKPFSLSTTTITPFVSLDWVNNWQGKVSEKGKSGFNLRLDSHYVSLLRSEIGVRLSQQHKTKHGVLKLEEGVSYVNKTPFNAKKASTYYVGSISSFNVQLFSNQVQNLGSLYLGSSFTPHKIAIPLIALNYQGEWGKKQISNTLALEMKQRF